MTLDAWLQILLAVMGLGAIVLVSLGRREGFVVGLLGQPVWFAIAWRGRLWGIFVLAIGYTASWTIGVWRNYRKAMPGMDR